ncbi:MAG: DNA polymerase III subunit delta' [Acidobacteriia bacterium]|nr:DNA polymerase III subunit delta' [Terriglobia bacterium]
MTSPLNFNSFVGNGRVVEILRRAVNQDRLPHALIFAGPAGVGKRTLALLLAQHLNCLQPANGKACNSCSSCRKINNATHPDVQVIQPDGAFIKIDQLRALIDEIAYQPFEGRFRVAILDGADQMRLEAANCLLKTLEEPPSRSILILVTARPYLLLRTIRSRARMLQFGPIGEDAIEQYLTSKEGCAPEDARLAAALSNGSLGAALAFDVARNREIRRQALRFVSLLLRRERFTQASALAAGIAKDKESFQAWVEMTATLLQDVYYAQVAPGRMGQRDLVGELTGLAQSVPHAIVVAAIEAVKNLKAGIQQNVNRQLALEALFLAEITRI